MTVQRCKPCACETKSNVSHSNLLNSGWKAWQKLFTGEVDFTGQPNSLRQRTAIDVGSYLTKRKQSK